jgi:hypothetical protein
MLILDWFLATLAAFALIGSVLSQNMDIQKTPDPHVDVLWDAL